MHIRCSICRETLGEANAPMTTSCGHLYCADCATQHFGRVAVCAICRMGPFEFDEIIKLYPDYENEPMQPSSRDGRTLGLEKTLNRKAVKAGMSALDAYYDALEDRTVLESPALRTAMNRTDDLVVSLKNVQVPELRTLLSNIMCILGDIRSKATSEHAVTVEATNANSPQVEPLRRRPPTIAELVERAQDPPWDPTKSLRHWLRTAEKARKDGNRHAEHQNHGSAFVEYARAALIIFEKLPTHQEYPTLLRVDQRQNLELNGQDILQSLSQLKPILKDEYKQWLATRSTAADRSRPSKNERSVDRKRNAR